MFPKRARWDSWIAYFNHNAANQMDIDWLRDYQLTETERHRITRSIQQFQLGESSEGRHVLNLARQYIAASGDDQYLPALALFIKEEQRHSQYLARFMKTQNISQAQSDPVDNVFRFLRHTFNLELSIMVMLTAEIIAVPYYKSLHDATVSPLLRQICRQLLRDEVQHLQFQLEILGQLRQNRSAIGLALTQVLHSILLTGTVLVVWQHHRSVLRTGGYSLPTFWRANWQQFRRLFANQRRIHHESVHTKESPDSL
jgi:hypothetical protein